VGGSKDDQRNAGITHLSSPRRKPGNMQLHSAAGNPLQPCIGPSIGRFKGHDEIYEQCASTYKRWQLLMICGRLSPNCERSTVLSVLVSALTDQVTARTLNQHGCDYCGEPYQEPGPIAWTSHHCNVLFAAETIISECVQHLLRERAVVKNEIERYLPNRSFLRRAV
jgi:hypothetical protein